MNRYFKLFAFFILLIPQLSFASGPSRLQVEQTIIINDEAQAVWAVIKDFGSLNDWKIKGSASLVLS